MIGKHVKEANLGFTGPVTVTKKDGNNWETFTGFRYDANEISFQVPAGSETDFASVPRVLAPLIPRAGDSVPAAILHDHLWRVEAPAGRITYREADGILRQALRVSGVPFVQRWLAWTAVRWGALTRKKGNVGWWKDAPLVLLWTVLEIPFIAPSAIGNTVTLVFLQAQELLAWPILRPVSRKTVNPPNVGIKT